MKPGSKPTLNKWHREFMAIKNKNGWTFPEMGEKIGVSKGHAQRLCKQETGLSAEVLWIAGLTFGVDTGITLPPVPSAPKTRSERKLELLAECLDEFIKTKYIRP